MKKENFGQAIDQVLKSDNKTIVQKVSRENKPKEVHDEKQVSFYIERKLLKQLKIKALEEGLNFKEIMTKTIEQYLE